jgi:hypothetical protein
MIVMPKNPRIDLHPPREHSIVSPGLFLCEVAERNPERQRDLGAQVERRLTL